MGSRGLCRMHGSAAIRPLPDIGFLRGCGKMRLTCLVDPMRGYGRAPKEAQSGPLVPTSSHVGRPRLEFCRAVPRRLPNSRRARAAMSVVFGLALRAIRLANADVDAITLDAERSEARSRLK